MPAARGRSGPAGLLAACGPGGLVLALVAAVTMVGLAVRPDQPGVAPAADQVIIAGAAGLRWDDLAPDRTPHLWGLAQQAAIGSLSVRSGHRPTCPADGWLTLGAGNWAADRAAARLHGAAAGRDEQPCPPLSVTVEPDNGIGAHLPAQEALVRYNQWELPWGAVPGALAGTVECTAAFGPGAAVAAARSFGRVDRYRPELPSDPAAAATALAAHCELAVVDLGAVAGEGVHRAAAVQRVDAALGEVLAARPDGSLLLVAGVSGADDSPHLHVAVADGPDLPAGWLTSPTTGRTGYLQLVDLAPTVLAALRRPAPAVPLAGSPLTSQPGRPPDLAAAVAELVAADQAAVQARPVATRFLAGLTAAQLALLLGMVPLLRQPLAAGPARRRLGQVLPVAAALAVPAALATGAVPWWRSEPATGVWFAAVWAAVLVAVVVVLVRAPVFRRTVGLVGAVAGVAAAAVAADLLTGSRLQLNGVVGYSALDGGRYAGLGPIGLGVLVASTLLVAACLAEQVNRRRRPLVVAGVGAVGVVLVGSPYLGADIGGAVALLVGVCVAAVLCTGGWLVARRVTWSVLVGLAVVVTVAVVDLQQPPHLRTGLGSLLAQVAEGTAGFGLQRVSLANAQAFTGTPLTVLAIGAGAFLWLALLRPWGGLKRMFGVHPALRAGMIGATVASLLGGILVGAALTVAGAAAAVGVPLLTLAALRLRVEQARRARYRAAVPGPAGPPVKVEFRGTEDRAD